MRYPVAETAAKHVRILEKASQLFKKNGFSGVSLAEIMKATGLTHGPFYNHFASKEALMTETIAFDSERTLAAMALIPASEAGVATFLDGYLSAEHCHQPEAGCLMAALSNDIGREKQVRATFTRHVSAAISRFVDSMPWYNRKRAKTDATLMVAAMVGAVALARSVDDDALASEILTQVRDALKARLRTA